MFDGYHENEVIQSNTKQTTAPFFLIFPKKICTATTQLWIPPSEERDFP